MVEKICALLAAFLLGGVMSFYVLTRCINYLVLHVPKTRAKIRAFLDDAERRANEEDL